MGKVLYMKKNKNIEDLCRTANIPDIDLERKINYRINSQGSKKKSFRLRTVLITALILSLTAIIAYATVRVVTNSDGSHTIINEEKDKTWTVNSEKSKELDNSLFHNKMFEEMRKHDPVGEEAVVGYYEFNEDIEPISFVRAAGERYIIKDDNYDLFLDNSNKPIYLDDILEAIKDDFKVSTLEYKYTISKDQIDIIIDESARKSVFGEVYTATVPVEREYWAVKLDLLTLDMDKFYRTSLSIFNDSLVSSPGNESASIETIMIGERVGMLSKRSDRTYIMTVDVNGLGLVFQADPRGDVNNIIEYTAKLIKVLEEHTSAE